MSYAVCRMQKMKSHDLKGMQFHNQRERESRTNFDIDPEKTKDNVDLVNQEPIHYNERVKEIIETQKTTSRKVRKDAVLVNELLVTSDREFFDKLSPEEEKLFFVESKQLFAERYGEQNVAYAMVHVDEKTPHMHLGVVPMKDGKLQGKNVFNRQELRWIQDEFPKHMKEKGFDLERGQPGSDRKHMETQKYKAASLQEAAVQAAKQVEEKNEEWDRLTKRLAETEAKLPFSHQETRTEIKEKLFGKSEREEVETGNIVLTPEQYQEANEQVQAAQKIKKEFRHLKSTDLVRELDLTDQMVGDQLKMYDALKEENKKLAGENRDLKQENEGLRARVKDIQRNLLVMYQEGKKKLGKEFQGWRVAVKERLGKEDTENHLEKVHRRENQKEKGMGM